MRGLPTMGSKERMRDGSFMVEGAFSRAWLYCIENGRDLVNPFLDYARLLADQAGFAGSDYVPDPIWDQAESTFDWPDAR